MRHRFCQQIDIVICQIESLADRGAFGEHLQGCQVLERESAGDKLWGDFEFVLTPHPKLLQALVHPGSGHG